MANGRVRPNNNYHLIIEIMNTSEIANRLISLCREGKWETAQTELYADDAVSIEAEETPLYAKETRGLPAILEKAKVFESVMEEIYSLELSEPLIAGNFFTITMTMDAKMKGQDRMVMPEICVYEVKDGKIVSEQFFS